VAEANTPRLMDAAGEYLLYYESRQNVPGGLSVSNFATSSLAPFVTGWCKVNYAVEDVLLLKIKNDKRS